MAHKAPGKSDRDGISLMALADMFPTEESALPTVRQHQNP